jgi:pimeloyl-ACP methyl ester carboxylesterase
MESRDDLCVKSEESCGGIFIVRCVEENLMKRYWLAALILFLSIGCGAFRETKRNDNDLSINIRDKLDVSGKKIDSFYDIVINDCPQRILVQSNDVVNNPILLYLHGGPGSSMLMYSHLYSEKLKDHFIFVNWDQRGTAFSFHEGMDASKISEDQIRDDALELIKYLTKVFHKKKVYLIGHSFGSAIGLQLVANHPEYFYAYVGMGQVASEWNRSVAITYAWLHETLVKANDSEGLRRIEKDRFPYIDLVVKYGGHHRLSIDLDSLKKTSPYYYEGYLDLAEAGKKFSEENVGKNPNLKRIFNRSIFEIPVPLYFFEGRHDHVIACAPELVVEYCQKVKAPKKEIVWFENSAHLINIEEPVRFQDELIKIERDIRE